MSPARGSYYKLKALAAGVRMTNRGWLRGRTYRRAIKSVAVPGIDLLLWGHDDGASSFGLILREVEQGREGWNLIGGRIRRCERIEHAIERHLRETLIGDFHWQVGDVKKPVLVEEYMPVAGRPAAPFDPRKHQVSLNYILYVEGRPDFEVQGEAKAFRWFPIDEPPSASSVGFGQWPLISALLDLGREAEEERGSHRGGKPSGSRTIT
jgi:ADP-ribose pyrophosphatase YjhB (NUDIX family)